MNKIYTITVCEKLEIDKYKFPDLGYSTTIGFYMSKDKAFNAVKSNALDMRETCYDFALIEETEEGLYKPSKERWWFKYNRSIDGYKEIPEPEGYKRFSGFSIG